jgi:hypothetical protein
MIYCNLTIFFDVHSGQRRIWSNSPFLVVIPTHRSLLLSQLTVTCCYPNSPFLFVIPTHRSLLLSQLTVPCCYPNSPFLVVIPSFFYSFRTRWFYTLHEFCQSVIETLVIYIVINWNTANLSFLPVLVEIHFIWVFFLGISWNSCYWGFFCRNK